jgi:hypothetical protein
MARITPKTNWVANNVPVAPDFNRIENNNQQAFTELDAETAARQAAITAEQNARTAAIGVETTNRQNADATLQTNIDTANSLRLSGDNAVQANLTSHVNSSSVHSASSDALASRIVIRDSDARASFASPTAGAHAATKGYVDLKYELNAIGSMAFMKNIGLGTITAGSNVDSDNGNNIRYSNSNDTIPSFERPTGTWRCLGHCPLGSSTLFIRVS